MEYTFGLRDLIKRDIIRDDNRMEYVNKMTNEEIFGLYDEITNILWSEGVNPNSFEWVSRFQTELINRENLYKSFKKC